MFIRRDKWLFASSPEQHVGYSHSAREAREGKLLSVCRRGKDIKMQSIRHLTGDT